MHSEFRDCQKHEVAGLSKSKPVLAFERELMALHANLVLQACLRSGEHIRNIFSGHQK